VAGCSERNYEASASTQRGENVLVAERLSVSEELYYHTLAKLLYKQ